MVNDIQIDKNGKLHRKFNIFYFGKKMSKINETSHSIACSNNKRKKKQNVYYINQQSSQTDQTIGENCDVYVIKMSIRNLLFLFKGPIDQHTHQLIVYIFLNVFVCVCVCVCLRFTLCL